MTLLEIRNLSKRFGGLAAIQDLDLDVNEGELLSIIGPNGAGKTTLFNVISGVYAPTKGEISFAGDDVTGLKPRRVAAKGIIRTFQANTFFQDTTVLENVALGNHLNHKVHFIGELFNSRAARRREEETQQKALQLLELFGLANLKDELAESLSHGHQRALGIVIAVAANPRLLLLDEPASGLNPVETEAIMAKIKQVRDNGVTVAVIEHDMRLVMGLSDRIVVLNYGKKIAEGLPEEIRENDAVIEAYLGTEQEWQE